MPRPWPGASASGPQGHGQAVYQAHVTRDCSPGWHHHQHTVASSLRPSTQQTCPWDQLLGSRQAGTQDNSLGNSQSPWLGLLPAHGWIQFGSDLIRPLFCLWALAAGHTGLPAAAAGWVLGLLDTCLTQAALGGL